MVKRHPYWRSSVQMLLGYFLGSFPSRARSSSFLAPTGQIIQFSHASDLDRRVVLTGRAGPPARSKTWSVQIALTKSQLHLALFSLALLSGAWVYFSCPGRRRVVPRPLRAALRCDQAGLIEKYPLMQNALLVFCAWSQQIAVTKIVLALKS